MRSECKTQTCPGCTGLAAIGWRGVDVTPSAAAPNRAIIMIYIVPAIGNSVIYAAAQGAHPGYCEPHRLKSWPSEAGEGMRAALEAEMGAEKHIAG